MARTKATIDAMERRFALLVCKGYNQSDAYREVNRKAARWAPDSVHAKASRFAARDSVKARIAELQKEARAQDILCIGEWLSDTMRLKKVAEDTKNLNAAQALNRQLGQATGAIGQDSTTIVMAEKLDDRAIIERLSRDKPELRALLADLLGADDRKLN